MYVRYAYRTYLGWKMLLAGLVCILGVATALVMSRDRLVPAVMGLVIIPVLAYFPIMYLVYPARIVRGMRRLQPCARISIGESGIGLATADNRHILPWRRFDAILEFDDYFLLVAGLSAAAVIPRKDLPPKAEDFVRDARRLLRPARL